MNMIKFIVIISIMTLFSFCIKENKLDDSHISSIVVKYVSWNIYTAPISCKKFEVSQDKEFVLTDTTRITQFYSLFQKTVLNESKDNSDTRIKLCIKYTSKRNDTLCIGINKKMELNGESINYDIAIEEWAKHLITEYDSTAVLIRHKM